MSTLLHIDSFDHYDAISELTSKWTGPIPGGSAVLVTGRFGTGQAIKGTNAFITLPDAPFTALTQGVGYNTGNFQNDIFLIQDLSNANTGNNSLRQLGDGRLQVIIRNAFVGSPSAIALSLNQWYFVEFQIISVFSGGSNTVSWEARVNNATILSGSTTIAGAAITYATVQLDNGSLTIYDDYYCTDTEFLGDHPIICLYTNADGSLTGWTPSAAGAHYLMTKEHNPDEDATYIYSSTPGDQELENLDDIPGPVSAILGGQFLWRTKKSNGGVATITGDVKSGGTTVSTATYYPSADNYLYLRQPYRKSPFTGVDFTATEVNAIQMGPTRVT